MFKNPTIRRSCLITEILGIVLCGLFLSLPASRGANALRDYVKSADSHYNWKFTEKKVVKGCEVSRLEMVSQHWRGQFWSHHMLVVKPSRVVTPDTGLLFITGDGDGAKYLDMLQELAERSGTWTAVITKVPNQPLYNGLEEDALIAYTFDEFIKTGDTSWPLLFPMVKSAVRGMDTLAAYAGKGSEHRLKRFVVTGASKRGWTTWLTAAADSRVVAIAPMVIDMLNMKKQTDWAKRVYGDQSEEISDYTQRDLIKRMDEPRMVLLRSWVDPYSYAASYKLPKLLLLGTNDPYWTVDSLRHYWSDLPEPKLVYQTPNAGHDLAGGKNAITALGSWYACISRGERPPVLSWTIGQQEGQASIRATMDRPVLKYRLWTADSGDRDFRNDKWSSQDLQSNTTAAEAAVQRPAQGYRAFLIEATLSAADGKEYCLSTEARVIPDLKP